MCHQSRNHGDSPTISYSSVIVSNNIPSSWKIPSLKRKHTMNDQEDFNCIRQCKRQLEKESICNDVRFVFTTISFVENCIYVICIYFRILVSNTISLSDYVRVVDSNTTGATSGAGTTNPSGAPEFTPG